jgi:hydrogenase nickel incorporation protein HypA/HybF
MRALGKASAVRVRVGRLSGIDREALMFSYGIACQDTPLENSQLIVEDVEIAVFCPACGKERPTQSFPILTCADCGSFAEHVIRGNELEIVDVEVP